MSPFYPDEVDTVRVRANSPEEKAERQRAIEQVRKLLREIVEDTDYNYDFIFLTARRTPKDGKPGAECEGVMIVGNSLVDVWLEFLRDCSLRIINMNPSVGLASLVNHLKKSMEAVVEIEEDENPTCPNCGVGISPDELTCNKPACIDAIKRSIFGEV